MSMFDFSSGLDLPAFPTHVPDAFRWEKSVGPATEKVTKRETATGFELEFQFEGYRREDITVNYNEVTNQLVVKGLRITGMGTDSVSKKVFLPYSLRSESLSSRFDDGKVIVDVVVKEEPTLRTKTSIPVH